MSENAGGADDYSDLGFDVEAHREALRVFADYGFSEATTRAGLKARDLVAVRMKSGKFGIGVTDVLASVEQGQKSPGCAAFGPGRSASNSTQCSS